MRTTLAVFALVVGSAVSGSAAEMTGYVSDHACATKKASDARATDWIQPEAFEACVKSCVKDGSEMVFVTEDNKVLKFDAASSKKAMPVMGHRVKVTGTASNGVLSVESIAAIPMAKK